MINANKLKSIMVEQGYTQYKLAKAIGMSKNTMTQKLSGKTFFDTEEANRICNILGITDDKTKVEIFLT